VEEARLAEDALARVGPDGDALDAAQELGVAARDRPALAAVELRRATARDDRALARARVRVEEARPARRALAAQASLALERLQEVGEGERVPAAASVPSADSTPTPVARVWRCAACRAATWPIS
jgi:hypothetical protein